MTDAAALRKPIDTTAFFIMLVLCMIWGFGHVAAKLAAPQMPLVMQGGARCVIAAVLLLAWSQWRGVRLFDRDGSFVPGLIAGALFAGEFLFIFQGLNYTGASRMVVFIYLTPCFTALGLHAFVPSERLHPSQWTGIALAFVGVAIAFWDGFSAGRASIVGDAFGCIAAFLWAATTVVIRTTALAGAAAEKTLLYQVGVSAVALPIASIAIGEPSVVVWTPTVIASLFYQGVVVTFASYLAWFWLLTRYLAARLSTFTFLTPLFGVLAGVLVLHEPLRAAFAGAVLLVGFGIFLVNRPRH